MKKRICGVIAQHFWELSPLTYPEGGEQTVRETLLSRLQPLIEEEQVERFLIAMERGFPFDVTASLLELRDTLGTELECVIPYEDQHIAWPEEVRDCYFNLVARCDKESMVQRQFTLDCYHKTIKYMLSQCDCFVIIWNGRASDAGDAVQLVRRRHLPLMLLEPSRLLS